MPRKLRNIAQGMTHHCYTRCHGKKTFYREGTEGPFWKERFDSKVIEEEKNPRQYLLWLFWYLGYNPVRKGLCRDPRKSNIGFNNAYLVENYELPIKITLHMFFYELGITFEECVKVFLAWEERYLKRLAEVF